MLVQVVLVFFLFRNLFIKCKCFIRRFTFQVVEIKLQIEFQEKRRKALNLKRISRKGNCILFHKKSVKS